MGAAEGPATPAASSSAVPPTYLGKVIVVGPAYAGKTSLVERFVRNEADQVLSFIIHNFVICTQR